MNPLKAIKVGLMIYGGVKLAEKIVVEVAYSNRERLSGWIGEKIDEWLFGEKQPVYFRNKRNPNVIDVEWREV